MKFYRFFCYNELEYMSWDIEWLEVNCCLPDG